MLWISWKASLRNVAIASLLLLAMACQPTSEAPSSTDEAETDTITEPSTEATENSTTSPSAEDSASEPSETASPDSTAAVAATPERSCSVSAYVIDTDPAGLNVRSGPGSDFAVQDTLPTDVPVEVSIVGANLYWFLINEAVSPQRQELERPGWIYAPLLGVSTTSLDINDSEAPTTLYTAPDGSAAVAAKVPKYSEVTLLDCAGDWLQVEHPEATGWLAVGEQCSNPTSTCP